MNIARFLLHAGKSYASISELSQAECKAALANIIDAKPGVHALIGTVTGSTFEIKRNFLLTSRRDAGPQFQGEIFEKPNGSEVRLISSPSQKFSQSVFTNVVYALGAVAGLLISALVVSNMVPKVYVGFLLVIIPVVSLAITLIVNRFWIVPRDTRFVQKAIALACKGGPWTDIEQKVVDIPQPSTGRVVQTAIVALISCLALTFVIDRIAQHFWRVGDYLKVELISRPAYELSEALLGENNLVTENCRYHVAEALRCEPSHQFKQCQLLFETSLDPKNDCLKDQPIESAKNLLDFGRVLDQTGRHIEADKCYRDAIDKWENSKEGGKESLWLARALDRLAMLCLKEHKFDDAEKFEKRALQIDQGLGKAAVRSVGEDLNDLALVYDQQDKLSEAETLYKQALAYKETHPESNSYSRATTLYNLAEIEKILNRPKLFDSYSIEAYKIWKKILRFKADYDPHPKITGTPASLGNVVIQAPVVNGSEAVVIDNSTVVPDPLTCYLKIMNITKADYEEPVLDTRFDGLRPYSGRE